MTAPIVIRAADALVAARVVAAVRALGWTAVVGCEAQGDAGPICRWQPFVDGRAVGPAWESETAAEAALEVAC